MKSKKRKLTVFNQVSIDGYFTGENGDLSWAHHEPGDEEWNTFVRGNSTSGGVLIFGRKTYEMMASFWPTPMAEQFDPILARQMNALEKVVFSKKIKNVSWENARLAKDDLLAEIKRMKSEEGPDMTLLGSGSIVSQLLQADLIDEVHIVIFPIVLGKGRTMFEGLTKNQNFKTTSCRTFKNGNVLISFEKA